MQSLPYDRERLQSPRPNRATRRLGLDEPVREPAAARRDVRSPSGVLMLQRTAGNRAATSLLGNRSVHQGPAAVSESDCATSSPDVAIQRGVGEASKQIWRVGPFDAWQAKKDADTSRRSAAASGLPGQRDGPRDAYRHALWNCLMTLSIGASQAKVVGDTHEELATAHPNVTLMDLHNNAIGRMLGGRAKNASECDDLVLAALRRGNLLIISNWREMQEARNSGDPVADHGVPLASDVEPEDVRPQGGETDYKKQGYAGSGYDSKY